MQTIAILGGGFTGAAAAIHLSRLADQALHIIVVEPRDRVGPGLAHSGADPDHRLNAPDFGHILYPEDLEHFPRWLQESGARARDPEALCDDGRVFPRRSDYGDYLAEFFQAHQLDNPSGSRIDHLQQAAIDLQRTGEGHWRVTLDNGTALDADAVLLALNPQQPGSVVLAGTELSTLPQFVANPWQAEALATLAADDDILLLGSALSSADVVATLARQGHRGRILALSRSGRVSERQCAIPENKPAHLWHRLTAETSPFAQAQGLPTTTRELVRRYRQHQQWWEQNGGNWCVAVEDMRVSAHAIWAHLNEREQRRFLRHFKSFYDTFRYRLAPQTAAILDKTLASGQLQYVRGSVTAIEHAPDNTRVQLRVHGEKTPRVLTPGAIINCIGFDDRLAHCGLPVLQNLHAAGVLHAPESGIGLNVNASGQAVSANAEAIAGLYASGPLTRGVYAEATGTPFILRQLLLLVPALLTELQAADSTAPVTAAS